jgi:16S rRNA (guanine527-N7)-methyltransferase
MRPDQFYDALLEHDIKLSNQQLAQFERYYELLVATNEYVNLTTITDKPAVYLKHFYDSITPAFYDQALQTQPLTLCDVGAGAGFPSLPMKIVFPQLKITIVDSLNKRINFLTQLVEELELEEVTLIHDRAETFGSVKSQYRESFDVVTARAVAALNVLSELCLPLVKLNGTFLAMKADKADDELAASQQAIATLGGQVQQSKNFELPMTSEKRSIVIITKTTSTPAKYPRRPGVPNKKPL